MDRRVKAAMGAFKKLFDDWGKHAAGAAAVARS